MLVRQSRLFKVGRTGRIGRPGRSSALPGEVKDTSKLSHAARRRIASPPMPAIERAVTAIGSAVERWGLEFVERVLLDVVAPIIQDRDDASKAPENVPERTR